MFGLHRNALVSLGLPCEIHRGQWLRVREFGLSLCTPFSLHYVCVYDVLQQIAEVLHRTPQIFSARSIGVPRDSMRRTVVLNDARMVHRNVTRLLLEAGHRITAHLQCSIDQRVGLAARVAKPRNALLAFFEKWPPRVEGSTSWPARRSYSRP